MNLKSGYPYSLVKNGLCFEYPKLEKDLRTDVLVLGGGISGALTAYELSKAGIKTVVLDGRSIGLGSTCASTGLLQYEIDVPLTKLSVMIGKHQALRAYKLNKNSISELGGLAKEIGLKDFRYKKSLHVASRKKDWLPMMAEFKLRAKSGFPVHLLSVQEVNKTFGFPSNGAILSDLAGETDAYLFTHYLHQYNMKQGVEVFDRSRAIKVDNRARGVKLVTAEGFIVRASKLVYATGYEAVREISKPIVKFRSTYAVICEPASDPRPYWKHDALIWNTSDPYLYLRTTADNRIIIGGRDSETTSYNAMHKNLPAKSRQLKKDFNKMFPLISFNPEFSWAGLFGSSPDGLPYIGSLPGKDNCFFALGYGGNGITFGQIAARIICDLVKGKKNRDAAIFSFNR